ncbi:hypothetical protein D3C85_292920 [compost metagenome]
MQILESNIHTFVKKLIAAIQEGWRVVPSNEGYISCWPLFDIKMYPKQEGEGIAEYDEYILTIQSYDAMAFLLNLQSAILAGYEIQENTLYWDTLSVKRIVAIDRNHPKGIKYSREQLDDFSWEEVKRIAKIHGKTGRDRELLVKHILMSQEEKGNED